MDLHRLRLLHELWLRETVTAGGRTLNYSPSSVRAAGEAGGRGRCPAVRARRLACIRLTVHGRRIARHAAQVLDLEGGRAQRAGVHTGRIEETVRVATLRRPGAPRPRPLTRLRHGPAPAGRRPPSCRRRPG
ncbi:hypothetical protein HBB16_00440 [Pseudonocardia sp. MCCB 268]|nr:hypothetical protein [Pseudonocardia cytotoxica]